MNKGWEIKELGEICEFENGDRGVNYPSKSHRTETGIPFINAGHLNSNGLDMDSMDYISRERFNLLGSGKVKKGDILFCLRGSLGKFAKVQEFSEGAIASSLVIVRPKLEITTEFLMLYFESKICADMIVEFGNGAAQPNLSAGSLKRFLIPLPPLSEQKRIVAILDKAFAAINKAKANTEKNLQNVKELFESYLQNVFVNKGEDWEEKRLADLFIIKPQKNQVTKILKETDLVTFLPMEDLDILASYIKPSKERRMKDVIGSYTYFADNDVLLAKITPCFENGKIGIARNLINGIGFGSSEYIVFRSNGIVKPEYLYYFLSRNQFRTEGKVRMTGAVGHKRVSKDFIEDYKLAFPKSLKQQEIIVIGFNALSDKVNKLQTIYQQKLDDLEELKRSLLQKAFKAELKTSKAIVV